MSERKIWTVTDVTDVFGPSAILRSYIEQRDVRAYLQRAAAAVAARYPAAPIACAVDIGCGYGRLTPVLGEFAPRVIG